MSTIFKHLRHFQGVRDSVTKCLMGEERGESKFHVTLKKKLGQYFLVSTTSLATNSLPKKCHVRFNGPKWQKNSMIKISQKCNL